MALPFDIANFNLVNFAESYNDLFDSVPKNVSIQVKDSNGNITTKTVANRGMFKKQIWDDVGAALGQFDRTFYVDQVNGDDNNDGSSTSPFKTIQKAANSVPVNGVVTVVLTNDYIGTFASTFRKIRIHIKSGVTWTIPMGNTNNITGSSVTVINSGKIIVDSGDGSNITGENYMAFYATNYEQDIELSSHTSLYISNIKITGDIIRVGSNRTIFGSRTYGANQNMQLNFCIYMIYCDGNIVLDGNILRLYGGCGSFQYRTYNNTSLNIIDSNGNAVDITTRVMGIIKDANGVPRNIISNIIF